MPTDGFEVWFKGIHTLFPNLTKINNPLKGYTCFWEQGTLPSSGFSSFFSMGNKRQELENSALIQHRGCSLKPRVVIKPVEEERASSLCLSLSLFLNLGQVSLLLFSFLKATTQPLQKQHMETSIINEGEMGPVVRSSDNSKSALRNESGHRTLLCRQE